MFEKHNIFDWAILHCHIDVPVNVQSQSQATNKRQKNNRQAELKKKWIKNYTRDLLLNAQQNLFCLIYL